MANLVELSLNTSPIGMNIFVIQAQELKLKIEQLYRWLVPFLFALAVMIVLLFMHPQVALWLLNLL